MCYNRLPDDSVFTGVPVQECYDLSGGILYKSIIEDVKDVYDKEALVKDKCWKNVNEGELVSKLKKLVLAFVKDRTYVGILKVLNICFIIATRLRK